MKRIFNCTDHYGCDPSMNNCCSKSNCLLCKICLACHYGDVIWAPEKKEICNKCEHRCPSCMGTCSECHLPCDNREEDFYNPSRFV